MAFKLPESAEHRWRAVNARRCQGCFHPNGGVARHFELWRRLATEPLAGEHLFALEPLGFLR